MNKKRLAILLIISIVLSAIPVYGMEIGPDTDAATEIETADIASNDSPSTESNSSEYRTEEQRAERRRIMTSITNAVVSSMDENWSELDKALYLANWLRNWTEYDQATRDYIKDPSSDNIPLDDLGQTVEEAIVDRKAVCGGFAHAYELLMNKAGLFCVYVSNKHMGDGAGHAWNLVRINGKYYYVDTLGVSLDSSDAFLFNHKFLKDEWEKYGLLKDDPNFYEERGKYSYGVGTRIYNYDFYDPFDRYISFTKSPIATKDHNNVIEVPDCDIHNKLKIYGDGTEEFLYKNLKVASGNSANNHKIYTPDNYFFLPEGQCVQYRNATYNGANHVYCTNKKTKKNCPDLEIHIYNTDGSEIDPSAYKVTCKNCKETFYKSEKKYPYFTIEWQGSASVDPILTHPEYRWHIKVNPADISTLDLKYKSAKIKNGKAKIKGLSFINECGKKINIKVLKNWNGSSSKSGCTATISDNTIILEGHGNYTGTATIPLS